MRFFTMKLAILPRARLAWIATVLSCPFLYSLNRGVTTGAFSCF